LLEWASISITIMGRQAVFLEKLRNLIVDEGPSRTLYLMSETTIERNTTVRDTRNLIHNGALSKRIASWCTWHTPSMQHNQNGFPEKTKLGR